MDFGTMGFYRTSGVLDENALREIKKHFIPGWVKGISRGVGLLFALAALLSLLTQQPFYVGLALLLSLFFFFYPNYLTWLYVRNAVRRLKETYPDGRQPMESCFTVEGMSLHNPGSGGDWLLRYEVLSRVIETRHYFYVLTGARQFSLVFKDCLTEGQQESFLPFLQERCPKLKIRRSIP